MDIGVFTVPPARSLDGTLSIEGTDPPRNSREGTERATESLHRDPFTEHRREGYWA
jgi:hypothetical protein